MNTEIFVETKHVQLLWKLNGSREFSYLVLLACRSENEE